MAVTSPLSTHWERLSLFNRPVKPLRPELKIAFDDYACAVYCITVRNACSEEDIKWFISRI